MTAGKHAFGFCDRTGFRYPLKDLVEQYINGVPSGLRVGKDMVDIDHEQLRLGEVDANDPQTLDNPRLDQSLQASREMLHVATIDASNLGMTGRVGAVTVEIT